MTSAMQTTTSVTRTAGMTAIAVCNFIVGTIFGIGGLFIIVLISSRLSKIPDVSRYAKIEAAFFFSIGLPYVLTAVILLAAGVGILRLSSWGRTLCFVFAWFGIAVLILHLCFLIYFMIVKLKADGAYSFWAELFVQMGGLLLVDGFYPAVLLYLFSQPKWKDAFAKKLIA